MPIFWGDYLRDTGHLTTVEHGAYMLLIGQYWTSGQPLPDDDRRLAQITKLSVVRWRNMRKTIAYFFKVNDGFWNHKRIDAELEKAHARKEKFSNSGKIGAERRWHRHADSDGEANGRAMPEAMAERWLPQPQPHPQRKTPPPPDVPNGAKDGGGGSRIGIVDEEGEPRPSDKPRFDAEAQDRIAAKAHELSNQVLDAAGIDPARWLGSTAVVQFWLREGYDATLDILPAIRAVAQKPSYRIPNTLAYFNKPIARMREERTGTTELGDRAPGAIPPAASGDPVMARLPAWLIRECVGLTPATALKRYRNWQQLHQGSGRALDTEIAATMLATGMTEADRATLLTACPRLARDPRAGLIEAIGRRVKAGEDCAAEPKPELQDISNGRADAA